jgi:phosphatidylserine decarboxylase
MSIDRAGYPFIGGAIVGVAMVWWLAGPVWCMPLLVLAALFTFFFRDPNRTVTTTPAAVLAPADGRVMIAGPAISPAQPPGRWQQISIFLSPTDVHVNRMPVGGRVTKVEYHPGRFLPAYRSEAGELNEFTEIWVDHGEQTVVFRQIVGILARRIVCRAREGDEVKAGDRFGVMKFGSRMDIFVPVTAALNVGAGDRVIGGVTVIAMLATSPPTGSVRA